MHRFTSISIFVSISIFRDFSLFYPASQPPVDLYIYTCISICLSIYLSIYLYIYIYLYICVCVCVCLYTHIYPSIDISIPLSRHIYPSMDADTDALTVFLTGTGSRGAGAAARRVVRDFFSSFGASSTVIFSRAGSLVAASSAVLGFATVLSVLVPGAGVSPSNADLNGALTDLVWSSQAHARTRTRTHEARTHVRSGADAHTNAALNRRRICSGK